MASALTSAPPLGWVGIFRLGLVQTALGAIVVLTTSTMNRVMVVELGLAASLPGFLVAFHYAVQMLRPRWGHGADVGGRRSVWILGGMAVLALGGVGASLGTAMMGEMQATGIAVAVVSFFLIGVGVGAAGTNLLALLATRVEAKRRAPAATVVWLMMIAGFAVTAGLAGHFLDPYSPERLVMVTAVTAAGALTLTVLALWRVEGRAPVASAAVNSAETRQRPAFADVLKEVWGEEHSRRFTVFVFLSMLAYSAQDLILEPFAGLRFGMTPGESTQLSGVQHGGVFVGMILAAVLATRFGQGRAEVLRLWTAGGCLASAVALYLLATGGVMSGAWPLKTNVFFLGAANGAFAVAAISSMMALAGRGGRRREGLRMGLWGAAQAIAFGLGGFLGAASVDLARQFLLAPGEVYAIVFALEATLFLFSARLALKLTRPSPATPEPEAETGTLLPSGPSGTAAPAAQQRL
jgi:BCD family chlorophyll transporter-like MFS transporter